MAVSRDGAPPTNWRQSRWPGRPRVSRDRRASRSSHRRRCSAGHPDVCRVWIANWRWHQKIRDSAVASPVTGATSRCPASRAGTTRSGTEAKSQAGSIHPAPAQSIRARNRIAPDPSWRPARWRHSRRRGKKPEGPASVRRARSRPAGFPASGRCEAGRHPPLSSPPARAEDRPPPTVRTSADRPAAPCVPSRHALWPVPAQPTATPPRSLPHSASPPASGRGHARGGCTAPAGDRAFVQGEQPGRPHPGRPGGIDHQRIDPHRRDRSRIAVRHPLTTTSAIGYTRLVAPLQPRGNRSGGATPCRAAIARSTPSVTGVGSTPPPLPAQT